MDLYLYEPSSTEAITEVGEQSRGELEGLCLPNADIEVGDRIDYGQYRYEVLEPIVHIPSPENPVVYELAFERVTNPTR
ncbi:hypothetical protein [Halorubrum ezzemoulense]|uniref:hypothetical protein n=1 Tax=Halorubrum ezzemoulense TaxID=337243 RepID=UPI00232F6B2E|nr:hypothetical protein [Halorubrum ezzemoulense]MDB9285391.1 hypothetical protein [Halorubrum ezzemoulense]MDB9298803.1 hypothetical protein [Halorubrum ezzemoulense]